MRLTYFCYVDIHINENFRNQDLGDFFFRNTSGSRAPAVAFRSTANLSIAPYSRSAKGVSLLDIDFIFGNLIDLMEALPQSNFTTLAYFCVIDAHLKENFNKTIPYLGHYRGFKSLQRRYRAQSSILEW